MVMRVTSFLILGVTFLFRLDSLKSWIYFVCVYFWTISSSAQALLLALSSRINPGGVQRTIGAAKEQTWASHVQDKRSTHCTIFWPQKFFISFHSYLSLIIQPGNYPVLFTLASENYVVEIWWGIGLSKDEKSPTFTCSWKSVFSLEHISHLLVSCLLIYFHSEEAHVLSLPLHLSKQVLLNKKKQQKGKEKKKTAIFFTV